MRKKIELIILVGMLCWVWVSVIGLGSSLRTPIAHGGSGTECGTGCICSNQFDSSPDCRGYAVCNNINAGAASIDHIYINGDCDPKMGTYSFEQYCDWPCGGGTVNESCDQASQPACSQGSCGGGQVCVSTGVSGCGCSNGASCDDYVRDPVGLTVNRIGEGPAATVTWEAPSASQYVDRQALIIGDSDEIGACILAAIGEQPTANCAVYEPNLAKTVGSYDAIGVLDEGTFYKVTLMIFAGDAPGAFSLCRTSGQENWLSSCKLTPDPTQMEVGESGVMTTNLAAGTYWLVSWISGSSGITMVSPASNSFPLYGHTTTASGVGDGMVKFLHGIHPFIHLWRFRRGDASVARGAGSNLS